MKYKYRLKISLYKMNEHIEQGTEQKKIQYDYPKKKK